MVIARAMYTQQTTARKLEKDGTEIIVIDSSTRDRRTPDQERQIELGTRQPTDRELQEHNRD